MKYALVVYEALDIDEITDFVNHVNEKLAEGWKLQGGVACQVVPEYKEYVFAQAVTKSE